MGDAGTSMRSVRAASAPPAHLAKLSQTTKENAALVHLSPIAEAAIRLLPGNDRCADCKSIYPQWAGVSFGVLLCLSCAGKHRALGVNVSFVKSLAMDSWSPTEQRALEVGGNAKWAAVCTGTSTYDLSIPQKYTTAVADAYKNRIIMISSPLKPTSGILTANEFLSQLAGATGSPPAVIITATAPEETTSPTAELSPPRASISIDTVQPEPLPESAELLVKCTACQVGIALEEIDSHSKRCSVSSTQHSTAWRKYDREFGRAGESLGFSLTKSKSGFAEITRVAPGGAAERAQVVVGSYIVGLNDHKTSVFEELVPLVSSLPRPIQFHLVFRPATTAISNSGNGTSRSTSLTARSSTSLAKRSQSISFVPEPVSVETEAVFDASVSEIGCVLQVQNNRCVVTQVDADSAAQRQGVLVGSCVAAVNGRPVLRAGDAIESIQKSARPLRIQFHRVEGLMRGWKAS